MPATTVEAADRTVRRIRANADSWATTAIDDRIALLGELLETIHSCASEWAALGAQGKGLLGQAAGEEWISGPVVTLRNARLLKRTLEQLREHGAPLIPDAALSQRADGTLVVQVLPLDVFDRVMMPLTAEVWMAPGVTADNLRQHMARQYRERPEQGRLALVLSAGNQSSIGPMDALQKLFVELQVVVLKMNPVNEHLGPVLERAFTPLIDRGYLAITYGGSAEGQYLCTHEAVDTIHITGSAATYDAIVWGPREGRDARRQRGEVANNKEVTSELGCITPIIVVPGSWSDRELRFQARSIASMTTHNSSFNCAAAQLVVTAADWPQRGQFLDLLREELAASPPRKAYYAGARDRWKRFCDLHPSAEVLAEDHPDTVPWTLIANLDHNDKADPCFTDEPWCGVLHEVPLPGHDAVDFLPTAVGFCNDRVWGTLSATVLIHPTTRRDPACEAAFQEALEDMRYGSIGVNAWSAGSFALCSTTWGAYPGQTATQIGSGRGVVHNTFMFDQPLKSVLYGPFTWFPRPPWFYDHGNQANVARVVASIEARPSVLKLPALVFHALLS
jgi:hypothetical protein